MRAPALVAGAVITFITMVLAWAVPGPAAQNRATPRLGFMRATFEAQEKVERRFRAGVSPESLSALHRPLSARPHMAGTDASLAVAAHLQRTLAGFGLDVETFDYDAFLSHPRAVRVEIVSPVARRLAVREPVLDEDPDSGHGELGDAFVAYSPSGDVTAPVVYVNYGLPDDYARLAAAGIDLKGRIALARYARSHRAVKVHTAEQAGAVGVLLYSDPADDGGARGPAWPEGYWRGDEMPQRGNSKYSWFWHGDPLTPGQPALPSASRLDPASAPTLPKIPVAVVSSGEARHLLEVLGGPEVPKGFGGGLPITYRTGPGDVRARISVAMDNRLRPIRNVVARLRGSEQPDRMVLLGGHHDAWTFGGVDPGTGAAALLEVARGLGRLAADGWRPRRTIGVAFWDAEEFGLVGSTEFAEHRRRELQEQLVAYVNTDMYMQGHFDAGGVPSLRDFVVEIAKDVPEGQKTVYEGWRDFEQKRAGYADPGFEVDLKALGSGADFVPFQDHLGIPTLSVEFIGQNGYGFGTYHSNFDSRAYVERIADPGFTQGAVLARVLGTLAMRMAGADVLPFRFSHYGRRLDEAVTAAQGWTTGAEAQRTPALDLGRVRLLVDRIRRAAADLESAVDAGLASGLSSKARLATLNDRLARLEQVLCDDDGDVDSRWYRHVVYGWNIYSLYDGQPFPGLAVAIRDGNAVSIGHEVRRIERALERMAAELETARKELG